MTPWVEFEDEGKRKRENKEGKKEKKTVRETLRN